MTYSVKEDFEAQQAAVRQPHPDDGKTGKELGHEDAYGRDTSTWISDGGKLRPHP